MNIPVTKLNQAVQSIWRIQAFLHLWNTTPAFHAKRMESQDGLEGHPGCKYGADMSSIVVLWPTLFACSSYHFIWICLPLASPGYKISIESRPHEVGCERGRFLYDHSRQEKDTLRKLFCSWSVILENGRGIPTGMLCFDLWLQVYLLSNRSAVYVGCTEFQNAMAQALC